jgi:hypothetical protein
LLFEPSVQHSPSFLSKNWPYLLLILLGVVVVIAVVGAGFFVYKKQKKQHQYEDIAS